MLKRMNNDWFNQNEISQLEKNSLPQFFDGLNPNKTPEVYKKYRDFMVNSYKKNPERYLLLTYCINSLNGDVLGIMNVHKFLESRGIINYGIDHRNQNLSFFETLANAKDKPMKTVLHQYLHEPTTEGEKLCMFGKNYPKFKSTIQNTISQSQDNDKDNSIIKWTEKEKLDLLKAIQNEKQTQINWEVVSSKVKTKTKEECLLYFLQLPIEENFFTTGEDSILPDEGTEKLDQVITKDIPLPFADTSNPIMSTIAFLTSFHSVIAVEAAQKSFNEMREQLNNNNFDVTKLNVKSICETALKAAALRSKEFAFKEERQIQRFIVKIIEGQLKIIEIKLKQLENIEKCQVEDKKNIIEETQIFEKEKEEYQNNLNKNSTPEIFDTGSLI